jgi:Flp pilus assembly protein TadB
VDPKASEGRAMNASDMVIYLIGATFALAIVFGLYQWQKAVKARREHHHSVAERKEMREEHKTEAPKRATNVKPVNKEFS